MSRPTTPVQPRRPGDPEPDLTIYGIAHLAMRHGAHELATLAQTLRDGAPLTPARAKALAEYVRLMTEEIHLHHHGEDTIGWPIIQASAGHAVDLEPLTADHDQLDPILDRLRGASALLVTRPDDPAARQTLATDSIVLRDLLDEHIEEEERDIFPIIRTYVSVADFKGWEEQIMKNYPKKNLWFLIPWSVSAVPPADVPAALALTPLAFRLANRLFSGRYRRFHQLIFG
ncbi:hypothetical protein Aple_100220 [Acrocarpospora pleiomorpha]|uniref:Hemerythrin-like domain-containing protein n=1 Tax=Acrocarpospora pleiomorpha TaxID=90975 RepID=A0A5M3Y4K0_9ACTN|nr:hemerythrin domain-containing protein [Acrocarpospora pleiomorpha]GES27123.1 hypothetical protein Aple_100220 [Acrocarpospora pleiomorpha]